MTAVAALVPRLAVIAAALLVSACQPGGPSGADGAPDASVTALLPDLQITVITPGTGATVRSGDTVDVHYSGWFFDPAAPGRRGLAFDSSKTRGVPFRFEVGLGRVIRGWDEGLVGMRIGEVRELAVPADLAYGKDGAGDIIPPHQALLFEVELVGIEGAGAP